MKRLLWTLCLFCVIGCLQAQKLVYKNALELNLIGKLKPTPLPYQRIDSSEYNGFTLREARLLQESCGLAVCFRTNSTTIGTRTVYRRRSSKWNSTQINTAGYDLYIRKDGKWLNAASNSPADGRTDVVLVAHMDSTEKECLLYLPLFSELESLEIGVDAGSMLEKSPNPFRHKVVICGSSFTHGESASRPGMAYPKLMERNTGLYFVNLGMSGNCKLQPEMARVLAESEADAFVFDAFSNPREGEIKQRFSRFVEIIREAHPTTPLIFLQTIDRERNNFDLQSRSIEYAKMRAGEEVVREAMKTDKHLYFIDPDDKTGTDHETSTDGIHPSDLGYYRWVEKIQPPLLKILKKYGVK